MATETEKSMTEQRFTRRDFLRLGSVVGGGILTSAVGVMLSNRGLEEDSEFMAKLMSVRMGNPDQVAAMKAVDELKREYSRVVFFRDRVYPVLTLGGGATVAVCIGWTLIKAL